GQPAADAGVAQAQLGADAAEGLPLDRGNARDRRFRGRRSVGARALRRRRAFLRADRARFRDRQDRGVGARGVPEQARLAPQLEGCSTYTRTLALRVYGRFYTHQRKERRPRPKKNREKQESVANGEQGRATIGKPGGGWRSIEGCSRHVWVVIALSTHFPHPPFVRKIRLFESFLKRSHSR